MSSAWDHPCDPEAHTLIRNLSEVVSESHEYLNSRLELTANSQDEEDPLDQYLATGTSTSERSATLHEPDEDFTGHGPW